MARRPQLVVEARVAEARDALVAALDAYLAELFAAHQSRTPAVLTVAQAAELLGCHPSKVISAVPGSIYRWRLQGGCSIWSADEMATRLGLHPTAVWGDEYFAVGATVGVA